ncbi:IS3 family transposase [Clostridium frigidicarnis]
MKHKIDEIYAHWLFYGSRRICVILNNIGFFYISRPTVQRYMREMGISRV